MGERRPGNPGVLAFGCGAGALALAQSSLPWVSLSVPAAWLPEGLPATMALAFFAVGNLAAGPLHRVNPGHRPLSLLILAAAALWASIPIALAEPSGATFLALFALLGTILGAASHVLAARAHLLVVGALCGSLMAFGLTVANWSTSNAIWLESGLLASSAILGLRQRAHRDEVLPESGSPLPAGLGTTMALLTGALLTSQLEWVHRAMEPYSGNAIHDGAVRVAAALSGLSAGFALRHRLTRPPVRTAILLLVLATVGALGALSLYPHLEWVVPRVVLRLGGLNSWPRSLALSTAENLLLTFPMAIAIGALWANLLRSAPQRWAWIAIGSLVATATAPGMLRAVGSTNTACFWIAATLLVAIFVSSRGTTGGPNWLSMALSILLLVGTFQMARSPLDEKPFVDRYGALLSAQELGRRAVWVTDDSERGRILRDRSGRPLGGVGTDTQDRISAQLAMLAHPAPKRVFLFDFGVGNGASSILSHPIERLDISDPQEVAGLTANFFAESNLGVLAEERLVLHDASPWALLASTNERWDLIVLNTATLEEAQRREVPTRERLRLLKERLQPGGMLSIGLNLGRISNEEARLVMRTVLEVFEYVEVWEGPLGYLWVLNASDRAPTVHFPDERQRTENPALAEELDWLDLDTPADLKTRFLMDTKRVRNFAGTGPTVTAKHPRVDAMSARSPLTFYGLGPAAADTPLANAAAGEATENAGLALLLGRIQELRTLKRTEPGALPAPDAKQ